MQDCELYGRILGIAAPWRVERVELQLKQGEVHVYLAHEDKREWPCAECGASCALYDPRSGERDFTLAGPRNLLATRKCLPHQAYCNREILPCANGRARQGIGQVRLVVKLN